MPKNVVYYLNQFYGGVGGEAQADCAPFAADQPLGPAVALNAQLRGGIVAHTIVCGDNFMSTHRDEALEKIGALLEQWDFDLLVAGPAFMAGRYGVACSEVCNYVQTRFQKPAFTCMHEENPGRDLYGAELYILCGSDKASGMRKDMARIIPFANKMLRGEPILWAEAEGYFPRGLRQEILLEDADTASERAFRMLMCKLRGQPFETEMPIVKQERVPIAPPVPDMSRATLAIISTCGIVPVENPDKIPSASATRFGRYDISRLETLPGGDLEHPRPGQWRTVHGGYDPQYANQNPLVAVPLDALHELEREGVIGRLYPTFYSTTGNHTNRKDATRMAQEIVR